MTVKLIINNGNGAELAREYFNAADAWIAAMSILDLQEEFKRGYFFGLADSGMTGIATYAHPGPGYSGPELVVPTPAVRVEVQKITR